MVAMSLEREIAVGATSMRANAAHLSAMPDLDVVDRPVSMLTIGSGG
jgi:hypothetical protein